MHARSHMLVRFSDAFGCVESRLEDWTELGACARFFLSEAGRPLLARHGLTPFALQEALEAQRSGRFVLQGEDFRLEVLRLVSLSPNG